MPSRVIFHQILCSHVFLQYSVNKELKFCGFKSLTTPKKLTANNENLILTCRDGLLIELFLFVFFFSTRHSQIFFMIFVLLCYLPSGRISTDYLLQCAR